MKRFTWFRLLGSIVPVCLGLLACGGGGGDGGGGGSGGSYVAASSESFSPMAARDKAANARSVALRWVYTVNNGQPVRADLLGISVGITFDAIETTIDAGSTQRRTTLKGPVSGSADGVSFSGAYSGTSAEDLTRSAGKTYFSRLLTGVELTLSGGGETGTASLTGTTDGFSPPYEWFLDRESLDSLPIGHTETRASTGSFDFNFEVTGETPIVRTNLPVSVDDRWTVLEKLPTMTVRGRTYANVVKLSLQTRVPDFSGNLTTVTMFYWVAKGIGMIRGEGIFRVLNIDNVVYELVETNLEQD